ncbi:MAG: hypothetical protein FJX25_13370 [Alphaproteobacteria bacterium]|nr:hypothetical protein [Alphaproteobacteria bacterium]
MLHGDIIDERCGRGLEQADEEPVRVADRQFESLTLYSVYVDNLTDQMLAISHQAPLLTE